MRFRQGLIILPFLLFIMATGNLSAQDTLVDLRTNAVLEKASLDKKTSSSFRLNAAQASLSLPFMDDFSKDGVYPDTSKWTDNAVFINRTYPRAPVTIGVATFDGLASDGRPYDFTAGGASNGPADTLTSKPLNLNFPASDSVYFSFYYQSQGLGNGPESQDSLVVEFYSPSDTAWTKVWGTPGFSPALNDSSFTYVVIPVTTSDYLADGFRFRFRNRATLSGNVDHWHVDYVRLDRQRELADSLIQDVAFVYQGTSFLKNYQSVPWKHYQTSDTASKGKIFIRNNFNTPVQMDYHYTATTIQGSPISTFNAGSENIDPYSSSGYSFCQIACPNFSMPSVNFTFPVPVDTVSYMVHHIMTPSADVNRSNDTLNYQQKLYDYYAYDDGTAEAGYGLNMNNGMVAYKFTMPFSDTLRALDIYFNPIVDNMSAYNFRITVWDHNSSTNLPGSVIYSNASLSSPAYDAGYYAFHRYDLDSVISVPATFYIGFIQQTSLLLNVGFDKNINSSSKIFYNTTGNWNGTLLKGSLMMRPVFSPSSGISVGIPEPRSTTFTVYPNPGNGMLMINNENEISRLEVLDLGGRIVAFENGGKTSVDISGQPDGVYFIRIIEKNSSVKYSRYILAR